LGIEFGIRDSNRRNTHGHPNKIMVVQIEEILAQAHLFTLQWESLFPSLLSHLDARHQPIKEIGTRRLYFISA
jgi:hypothetical protein